MLYEEKQFCPLGLYITVLLFSGLPSIIALESGEAIGIANLAFILMAFIFVTIFAYMRITIEWGQLRIRMGWLVPLYTKTILLSTINHCEVITYRPIFDCGWRCQYVRVKGVHCRLVRLRGKQGVLLKTSQGCFVIGSQDPETLKEFLSR